MADMLNGNDGVRTATPGVDKFRASTSFSLVNLCFQAKRQMQKLVQ